MFNFVHHVDYVVRNRDELVAYMEKNFGMIEQKKYNKGLLTDRGPYR